MLSDVVPIERSFTIGGREWRIPVIGFATLLAELEVYIFEELAKRLNAMCANVPKEVAEKWQNQAFDQAKTGISLPEAFDWIASSKGIARAFWIATRKHHAEVTIDDITLFLNSLGGKPDELVVVREMIDFAWGMEQNPSRGASPSAPQDSNATAMTVTP